MSTRTAGWDSDGAPRFSDGAGRGAGFAPRRNALLGEGIPTRRMSKRICPAQERSLGEGLPTRRASERVCPAGVRVRPTCRRTAGRSRPTNSRKNTPSAGSHPRRRTSERICPRRNTPLGEGLPTRRTGERSCPTRERSPRRRPPDTAHERKGLPHAETLPTQKRSPRRRHPDTAHERKDLPRARTLSSAKASRHGARAKGFAPREKALLGESLPTRRTGERICPRGVRPRPTCRRTAGRPRSTDSRKTPLRRGRTHSACGRCRVHSPKKK